MPEIKHVFSQGKMNKDLDERLIPNGQYTDANNIQVSTSDADDVGTVQSLLGNTAIPIAGATTISSSYCSYSSGPRMRIVLLAMRHQGSDV